MLKKLFCSHRHGIDSHPNCFASDDVILTHYDAPIPWYQNTGYKIGYLDIEADGLNADFGTMLTWCIKEKDGEVYSDVITKKELFNGKRDRRIVASLLNKMSEYKIIVTYYGGDFHYDIPFIRAKALHFELEFPPYGSIYQYDLYNVVKQKLCLSRRSLDNACQYLHIKGKTPLDKDIWRDAKYGDEKAIEGVLEHNVGDVQILEQLHNKLVPFRKWGKSSI